MADRSTFFENYKKNLLSFCQFLTSNNVMRRMDPKLIAKVQTSERLLKAANKCEKIHFDLPCIELQLRQPIKCGVKADSYLSLGGRVCVDNKGLIDQSVSVCVIVIPHENIERNRDYDIGVLEAGERHIVRRFHFDIDSTQDKMDRPIVHLQYGGNVQDEQRKEAEYQLISTIDIPRIPTQPLDVIQVINFIFHQFDTQFSREIKGSRWRSVVLENDKIWKAHYLQDLIDNIGKKKTMYQLQCEQVQMI